ncbi:hypothetical protein ACQ86D_51450 [Streptomyces galilaeus]
MGEALAHDALQVGLADEDVVVFEHLVVLVPHAQGAVVLVQAIWEEDAHDAVLWGGVGLTGCRAS